MAETTQYIHQSRSKEWYTPTRYLDAVRQVLGVIDLDPASCAFAQRTVQATRYYTQEENGLTKSWVGRVFLNPPYGKVRNKSNQGRWSRYLMDQYRCEATTEAILLVTACTSEQWFQVLWDYPMCLTDHRIRFYGPPDQAISGNTKGGCFVYFGARADVFSRVFCQFGPVILPEYLIRKPHHQLSLVESTA